MRNWAGIRIPFFVCHKRSFVAHVKSKYKIGLICQTFRSNNHAAINVSNRFFNNVVSAHMKGMRMFVGYARISTPEQSFDLLVWCLDRLGRSLKHLIEVSNGLHEREVGFKSLIDAIDTLTPTGQFFFHVTGAFAELERNLIRERTRAGLKAARARGRNGGRPKAIDPKTFNMAIEIYNSKKQRLAKCVNGWVLPNEHFTGIWNRTTSNNELTYRTFRGLGQKSKRGSWK